MPSGLEKDESPTEGCPQVREKPSEIVLRIGKRDTSTTVRETEGGAWPARLRDALRFGEKPSEIVLRIGKERPSEIVLRIGKETQAPPTARRKVVLGQPD